MEVFTVAFFGHRYIDNVARLEELLAKQVEALLERQEFIEFIIGRNGEFDKIAASVIHKCRRQLRDDNSALTLLLPYSTAELGNNIEAFEGYYDSIEISAASSAMHPKAAISLRNREMAERAKLIICYVDKMQGGAYNAVMYAKGLGIDIINLAEA